MDEQWGVVGHEARRRARHVPAENRLMYAAGSPVKTAFEVTVDRPDESIGELDPPRATPAT